MEANTKCNKARGLAVHDLGLIDGNVNNFGHRRNNADVLNTDFALIVNDNLLLGCGDQIAHGARLGTQPLHGLHDIFRLRHKRLAELLRPLEICIHVFENAWVVGDRRHAGIPGLCVDLLFGWRATNELGCADDIKWIGRRGQELGEQGIGVERDGTNELIELGRTEHRDNCNGRNWRRGCDRRRCNVDWRDVGRNLNRARIGDGNI